MTRPDLATITALLTRLQKRPASMPARVLTQQDVMTDSPEWRAYVAQKEPPPEVEQQAVKRWRVW